MKEWNFAFLLLLVFHATNATKEDTKLDEKITPLIKNCVKAICPLVHKPVCAKLLYNQTGHVAHVRLSNECEMKYVECYPGVQAKLVSMQFCDREHGNSTGRRIGAIRRSAAFKRVKRELSDETNAEEDAENLSTDTEEVTENLPMDVQDTDLLSDSKEDFSVAGAHKKQKKKEVIENRLDSIELFKEKKGPAIYAPDNLWLDSNEDEIVNAFKKQKKKEVIENRLDEIEIFKEKKGPAIYATKSKQLKDSEIDEPLENAEDKQFYESFNWRQVYPKADMGNYEADCPNICPIRPVMVCGRCEHGIYTTFLSVCHMRMHYCSFKNDSIELVARYPCMMLAPILPLNAKPKPLSGRVNEPDDDDKVLRYIWCRERDNKGAYCKKNVEEYQILSAENEYDSEDDVQVTMNDGDNTDNPNLPMNTGDDTDNPNLSMNAGDDTDYPDLPMNAGDDTDNPDLPMKAADFTDNQNTSMNTGVDSDNPNLPMNTGDDTDKSNLRSKSKERLIKKPK